MIGFHYNNICPGARREGAGALFPEVFTLSATANLTPLLLPFWKCLSTCANQAGKPSPARPAPGSIETRGCLLKVAPGTKVAYASELCTYPLIRRCQIFRKHPRLSDCTHEIHVGDPARQDVHMNMSGDSCSCGFAQVHAQVEAV